MTPGGPGRGGLGLDLGDQRRRRRVPVEDLPGGAGVGERFPAGGAAGEVAPDLLPLAGFQGAVRQPGEQLDRLVAVHLHSPSRK